MVTAANIKLSRLVPSAENNSRVTDPKAGLAELVASIKSIGLINPIVVRETPGNDVFEVIDGHRRLAALLKVHGKKDVEVAVMIHPVAEDDRTVREMSLAANVVRVNLHPIDEFEAYHRMIKDGWSIPQIAHKFGVKEKWIQQRLQLERLAPSLRELWKKGTISADQAEALSSSAEHDRQVAVWKDAAKDKNNSWGQQAKELRRALSRDGIDQDDVRVKFIGVEAYAAAGGAMTEDLFSDTRRLMDRDLLDRLVSEKFAPICADHLAHGWAWARWRGDVKSQQWQWKKIDLTPWATEAEIAAMNGKDWGARNKAADAVRDRAVSEPAARALSGVILDLDSDGDWEATVLLRDPDLMLDGEDDEDEQDEADEAELGPAPSIPAKPTAVQEPDARVNFALRETLSEVMTVAMSKALANSHDAAFSALLACLEISLRGYAPSVPLKVSTHGAWPAMAALKKSGSENSFKEIFEDIHAKSVHDRLNNVAWIVGQIIDLRQFKAEAAHASAARKEVIDAICREITTSVLNFELSRLFDAEDYFKRSNAEACKAALKNMGRGVTGANNKAEMVAHAVAHAKATGWLPVELRTIHYAGPNVTEESK